MQKNLLKNDMQKFEVYLIFNGILTETHWNGENQVSILLDPDPHFAENCRDMFFNIILENCL